MPTSCNRHFDDDGKPYLFHVECVSSDQFMRISDEHSAIIFTGSR